MAIAPQDRASQLYIERIHALRQNPPGADWDGVWPENRHAY
ncbi:MAG: hypothetical protein AAGG51_16985 [Cyanobacteria bacterium P01_G01_bin.54]